MWSDQRHSPSVFLYICNSCLWQTFPTPQRKDSKIRLIKKTFHQHGASIFLVISMNLVCKYALFTNWPIIRKTKKGTFLKLISNSVLLLPVQYKGFTDWKSNMHSQKGSPPELLIFHVREHRIQLGSFLFPFRKLNNDGRFSRGDLNLSHRVRHQATAPEPLIFKEAGNNSAD